MCLVFLGLILLYIHYDVNFLLCLQIKFDKISIIFQTAKVTYYVHFTQFVVQQTVMHLSMATDT